MLPERPYFFDQLSAADLVGAVIKNSQGGKSSQEGGHAPASTLSGSSSRVQNPLYILRNHIRFQVHFISGLELREISNFPGLGNHGNVKIARCEVGNRQTNSLNGH